MPTRRSDRLIIDTLLGAAYDSWPPLHVRCARTYQNAISTSLPSISRLQVAGSRDSICQPAPPRTSRSVCSDTAGRGQSSLGGLASEKQLSSRVAPGLVAR